MTFLKVYKFKTVSIVEGLVISWFLMSVFIIVDLILNYSLVRTLIECKNGNHTKQSSNDGASDGHDENIESCFQTTSSKSSCFMV